MKNGYKLKELIEASGTTQRKFATDLGVAPSTLSGYINSLREPDIEMLFLIAKKLDISIDFLMDFCSDKNGLLILNAKENDFIEKFRKLTASQREMVTSYTDFLLSEKAN